MTTLEDVVPADHPLREIRAVGDRALSEMSPTLETLYASAGRPSIAPEYLLRAQLAEVLYAIPSERRLVERRPSSSLLEVLAKAMVFSEEEESTMQGHIRRRVKAVRPTIDLRHNSGLDQAR